MAENIIKELLLKAKNDLESARKAEARDRLNIYYDNWKTILSNEVDNQFSSKTRKGIKQMLALDGNVLKRIVEETSIVYQQPAKRAFISGEGDTAKEDERYNELMSLIPVNVIMEENNQLTNLCNENLVYIVPRNNRIEYDLITPDIVEVCQSQTNATEVEAIVFTQTFVDTKGDTTLYYIYWDIWGVHRKYDEEMNPVEIKDNTEGINPYKDPDNPKQTILPFEIFHKKYPKDSVWNMTSGEDMVSGTKQIGVLLTYLNYLIKMNTFKQKVTTGIPAGDIAKDPVHDPLWIFSISNPDGDVKLLDYQTELKKVWDLIQSKIGAIANNYGMSLDNFQLIGDAQSGFALRIKNLGLEKAVKKQIKLYRWHEKSLAEKTRIINNQQYKTKIDEKAIFKIDYAEQSYPENPEDVRKQWKFDISMGAKSITDYAMFVNPDIKDSEGAIKSIEKNVEENKKVEEKTGLSISDLLKNAFSEEEEQGSTE